MHTLCTSQVKTNTKPPPFILKLPLLPWSIWENGMHCVVLTATCCICAFRSDTSDLSKWTLSYTIFSWTPNSMQKKIKNLFFFFKWIHKWSNASAWLPSQIPYHFNTVNSTDILHEFRSEWVNQSTQGQTTAPRAGEVHHMNISVLPSVEHSLAPSQQTVAVYAAHICCNGTGKKCTLFL